MTDEGSQNIETTQLIELPPRPVRPERPERPQRAADVEDDSTILIDLESLGEPDNPVQERPQKPVAPLPLLDARRAKPFPFERLSRIPAAHIRDLDHLAAIVPAEVSMMDVARSLSSRLEELVGRAHQVEWNGMGSLSGSESTLPFDDGLWTWGRMPPENQRFVAGAEGRLAEAWSEAISDKDSASERSRDFEFGIMTFVLAEFFALLCDEMGWPGFCWAVNPMRHQDLETLVMGAEEPVLQLVFHVRSEGVSGAIRLWMPGTMVRRLSEAAEGGRREPEWSQISARAWWGGLVARRPLIAGTARLTKGALNRLEVGDIVMAHRHGIFGEDLCAAARNDGARWVVGDGLSVTGSLAITPAGTWQFEVSSEQFDPNNEEAKVTDSQPEDSPDGGAVSVEMTRMDVEIRIGKVEMELSQIAQLRTGQVIDCGQPVGGPVDLVVGGACVGRGELVSVDGRLGVRILAMGRR